MATDEDEGLQDLREGLKAKLSDRFGNAPMLVPIPEDPDEDLDPEDIPEDEQPSGPDDVSEFDQKYREPFLGLLHLGYLTKTVTVFGHDFYLVTPTERERLEAGVVHKRFINTISAGPAWTAIMVALYLHAVDGSDLPEPIGPSTKTAVEDRFSWVVDNIKSEVINLLAQEVAGLEADVGAAFAELERLAKTSG